MSRTIRGMVLLFATALVLAAASRGAAQGCAPPPAVAYYPPAVAYYYTPPAVPSYAPPAVSYYTPPAVSYYAAPAVSYYTPPAYPAATVTTRYGLFGRPRVTVTRYYAP